MTDVMLRRSGRIKAGLEERVLNRFHKQMLQSNRTVTEQDLSFLAFGSSAAEQCQCHLRSLLHTVDRHVICF